ncbi:MAG: hypothetical protein FJ247_13180 [Nitrospira sp.]|nr:hypothetical protein [Nitrospira sp.]
MSINREQPTNAGGKTLLLTVRYAYFNGAGEKIEDFSEEVTKKAFEKAGQAATPFESENIFFQSQIETQQGLHAFHAISSWNRAENTVDLRITYLGFSSLTEEQEEVLKLGGNLSLARH